MRVRVVADALLGFAQAGRPHELNLRALQPQIQHVSMRVDESGQQSLAVSIDPLRVGVFARKRGTVAGLENAAMVEGQRIELHELPAAQGIAVDMLEKRRGAACR